MERERIEDAHKLEHRFPNKRFGSHFIPAARFDDEPKF
jgi:hypothetical protein